MGAISRWAVNRPVAAIVVWLLIAASFIAAAFTAKSEFRDSFALPGAESTKAADMMAEVTGQKSDGISATTAKIVWTTESGKAADAVDDVQKAVDRINQIGRTTCVITPYAKPEGPGCPPAPAADPNQAAGSKSEGQDSATGADGATKPAASKSGTNKSGADKGAEAATCKPDDTKCAAPATKGDAAAAGQEMPENVAKAAAGLQPAGYSIDGKVGFLTVSFTKTGEKITPDQAREAVQAVQDLNKQDGITAGVSSDYLREASMKPPISEIIGIIAALIILTLVFGSVVAGFLPVIAAAVSLGVGMAAVSLLAVGMDVATFAPTLAMMIGLGVGIDYALFIINRYILELDAGVAPKQAAIKSMNSAGRAVVFAAFTVVVALLGLLSTRVELLAGLALASSLTVLFMMVGSVFLLPAVLSLMGTKVLAWKIRRKPREAVAPEDTIFGRYGSWLSRNYKAAGFGALVLILVLAYPVLSMRQGFADDSNLAEGNTGRIAYELVSEGFGEGVNGPFIVTSRTGGDAKAAGELVAEISKTEGVAAALPVPGAPGQDVAMITVIPETGPSNEDTDKLLKNLRNTVIPDTTTNETYVGGATAVVADFTTVLSDALPLFLAVVIGLGFIMLVFLFQSFLIPLTGVVTSLLSFGAALGVTVAVFQWGWAKDLLGVDSVGPIMPFLPVMVFALLFGLSMDYQVFLVSRMQEEWEHRPDNHKAIIAGMGTSGRVVAIAAAIMVGVFGSFIMDANSNIKLFGVSLTAAVLFDAFIVRLVIVPALMFQLGKANWWLPSGLKRILPSIKVD